MNYDAAIQEIIDVLKADKSIPAEYRNAVISTGRRWQCEVRGARTMTVRQAPNDLPAMQFASQQCTCTELGTRKDCPVHGVKA
jgi:hypothetical protein